METIPIPEVLEALQTALSLLSELGFEKEKALEYGSASLAPILLTMVYLE